MEINLMNGRTYITYEYENDEQNIVKKICITKRMRLNSTMLSGTTSREGNESTNFNKDGQIEGLPTGFMMRPVIRLWS